jgi:hypothetical protein
MISLRCPECQLVLGDAADEPTDLLTCPACGAVFHWNPSTGLYTLFYDPEIGQGDPPPEGAGPSEANGQDETDGTEDSRSHEEALASIAAKRRRYADERRAEELRSVRRSNKRFLIIFFLVLCLGIVGQLIEGRPLTFGTVLLLLAVSLLLDFGGRAFVAVARKVGGAVFDKVRQWRDGKPEQPELDERDLDEIADRAKAKVIRRPRVSGDSPEGRHDPNAIENTGIIGATGLTAAEPTPPTKDGPADPITPNPPRPAAPEDSTRARPGGDS